jgi:hypothetical protein
VEGNFLESKLPTQAFATLETFHQAAQCRADRLFSTWIQGVQAHNRVTLGWIKSIESNPQPHIHAALIAATPLDCVHAATLWQAMVAPRYSKAARIKPYRRGLCGLGYVLKRLGNTAEDIQFSDNIASFATGNGNSLFRTSSAERRQRRRIETQLSQDSGPLSP